MFRGWPPGRLARAVTVRAALLSLFAGGVLFLYARFVELGAVEVVRHRLLLSRLAPEFHNYRLVHISDIHMDEWMSPERLSRIVQMVNAETPDAVAITGDFVSHSPERYASSLTEVLQTLKASDVVVAVLGNHDHWTDAACIRQVLRDAGVVELSNSVHTLRRAEAELHLAGVDCWWERHARLDLVLSHLPWGGAAILLAHEPDFADLSAPTGRFDLQLSGHSHGGQVRLPLRGPLAPPLHSRKYPDGQYQVGGMVQYTNRGLGTAYPHPRVRLNAPPEITVFTLLSPQA